MSGEKMAERRMFSKLVVDSDMFLDMPLSAQALYFHLSMHADDDGFLNNSKKIRSLIGAAEDDLKLLIAKGFVISFDTGIVAIRHWRMNNYLRKDRYTPTIHQRELVMLEVEESGEYLPLCQVGIPDVNQAETACQPQCDQMETQNSKGKDISKDNKNNMCKADALALFERLWKLYPVKKGKGQVSDTKKMKLFKIGFDEIARAIERYKQYVDSVDYLSYQNGSTFFNSGYMDYLDENYNSVIGGEVNGDGNQSRGEAADFYEQFLGVGNSNQD